MIQHTRDHRQLTAPFSLISVIILVMVIAQGPIRHAHALVPERDSGVTVGGSAEIGAVRSLVHTIQIGRDTYRFDYVEEGGQEILLPFFRFEINALLGDRHELGFLYQPLTLATSTRVDNPEGIVIDDMVFADDTPLNLQYGFDFYRATYRYRLVDGAHWRFSLGGALQIRNASIIFDGFGRPADEDSGQLREIRTVSQDLGPVPVISMAGRRNLRKGNFLEFTLDGFFAPIRYLNLRDVDVVGWLYDASLRAGTPLFVDQGEAYLSLRVLGGGADGTGADRRFWTQSRREPRYTWNNLNLAAISLGVRI